MPYENQFTEALETLIGMAERMLDAGTDKVPEADAEDRQSIALVCALNDVLRSGGRSNAPTKLYERVAMALHDVPDGEFECNSIRHARNTARIAVDVHSRRSNARNILRGLPHLHKSEDQREV